MSDYEPPHKQDLISKTIQRPSNACRIVITLEVSVDPEVLRSQLPYQRHCVDYIRAALKTAEYPFTPTDFETIADGVEILGCTTEVGP